MAASPAPIATDALVIGAGPVGLFQVFQLGLHGLRAQVVDALAQAGGQCAQLYPDKPIYDIPALAVCTGAELTERLLAQIAPFQPQFHWGQQVQALAPQADGRWLATTASGHAFMARAIFIAAGVGAFVPRLVKAESAERFAGTHLHYHPVDLSMAHGQRVVVHGGDEAAVAAALACADVAQHTTLLHRRDKFDAPQALLQRLHAAREAGRIHGVAGQITALDGAAHLQALRYTDPEGAEHTLPADQVLAYLGLSPKLGPIADWGLALDKKQLVVDTATFATSAPGIYAVGDVNTYPGKRKLILCGFHEATLAAFAAAERIAGHKLPLEYTTSSARLQALLQA